MAQRPQAREQMYLGLMHGKGCFATSDSAVRMIAMDG